MRKKKFNLDPFNILNQNSVFSMLGSIRRSVVRRSDFRRWVVFDIGSYLTLSLSMFSHSTFSLLTFGRSIFSCSTSGDSMFSWRITVQPFYDIPSFCLHHWIPEKQHIQPIGTRNVNGDSVKQNLIVRERNGYLKAVSGHLEAGQYHHCLPFVSK